MSFTREPEAFVTFITLDVFTIIHRVSLNMRSLDCILFCFPLYVRMEMASLWTCGKAAILMRPTRPPYEAEADDVVRAMLQRVAQLEARINHSFSCPKQCPFVQDRPSRPRGESKVSDS